MPRRSEQSTFDWNGWVDRRILRITDVLSDDVGAVTGELARELTNLRTTVDTVRNEIADLRSEVEIIRNSNVRNQKRKTG